MPNFKEPELEIRNGILYIKTSNDYRPAVVSECHFCGQDFPHRYINNSNAYKYCSQYCTRRAKAKGFDKRKVTKHCVTCGIAFKVRPSDVPNHTTCGRQYCFKTRMRNLLAERRRKELHERA